jgi:aspartate oxidase
MARKKKAKKDYKYRLLSQYRKYPQHEVWLECTLGAKEKIEKMFPMMYEFVLQAPPEMTPNMKVDEANEESE